MDWSRSFASLLGNIHHRRARETHQIIRVQLEHRMRMAGCRPDLIKSKQILINQNDWRDGMRNRCHAVWKE